MTTAHRPRKRFGQHFLRSPAVLSQIVDAIQPKKHQHLVEIGPGQGVLTERLLPYCQHLDAIEIDHDLVHALRQRFQQDPRLTLYDHDALTFDFQSIACGGAPLRVVGNLPYNISSPLFFHLFQYIPIIEDMHFMVQKEMGLRMTAVIGSKHYNRLSVMAQYFCQNELLLEVPPHAFFPVPKVDSVIIRMIPNRRAAVVQDNNFLSNIVKIAFAHRRKTLNNCFKGVIDREKLHKLKIDANLRAEQLSVSDFVNIANALYDNTDEK